VDSTRMAIML